MTAQDTVRRTVIDWLDDNYHFGEAEQKIGDDDRSFLDNGVLDSLGFVKLVLHLEETFGIRIERKNLTPRHLDSLHKIATYVTAHPEFQPS
jgi:acyl carrier protein